MKYRNIKYLLFLFIIFIININFCYAENHIATINGTSVNIRKGPGTNYDVIKTLINGNSYIMVSPEIKKTESGCDSGWYQIYYDGTNTGFVCSNYVTTSSSGEIIQDQYDRPWTTPKKAIIGGAKFITKEYINAGQNTSYLKKFNVNPNGNHSVYNHQYMANLQAPYSESYSSYTSYKKNGLLALPLEFTIPVFNDMNDYYSLPGSTANTTCQSEVTDATFEALLQAQSFPESYRCKLRIIHNTYPNWVFKALHTNLDFNRSVMAEQSVSSIQGGDIYYDLSSGGRIETERGWYKANYDTVAYYLDPRNFLNEERILMFEDLGYSENYTTPVVQTILQGTFMQEYSLIDNQSYAEIFVEAGVNANISAVYLASLARQESGVNGSVATSGNQFTYKGITYISLYNFYNIGASSSAESPVLAGLVWASGGSTSVITPSTPNTPSNGNNPVLTETDVLTKIKSEKKNDCLVDITIGSTLSDIKSLLNGLTVTVEGATDTDILKTGQVITITDGTTTYSYTLSIKGDVDGDGLTGATDYVKIKNYIMEKENSELNIAQSLAADADNNSEIGATDYVKIKNSIMEG